MASETKLCPECRAEIPAEASVCRFCGERIEGKLCPDCRSYCKPETRRCRWCGKLFHESVHLSDFKPFEVKASIWASILTRGSFFAQVVRFNKDRIVITTYGFLGLYSRDEEVAWDKVAGFMYRSGILWDRVTIETRGQTPAIISCLDKRDGQVIRRLLQSLEK